MIKDQPVSWGLVLTPPREGATTLQAHAEALSGLDCTEGIALEIAGRGGDGVRFLARSASAASRDRLAAHLRAMFPQGRVSRLADQADPVILAPETAAEARELRLVADKHLPLSTAFATDSSHHLDALLGHLRGLPEGVEALCQIAVWPARTAWEHAAEQALVTATETSRAATGIEDSPFGLRAAALLAAVIIVLFHNTVRDANAGLLMGGIIAVIVVIAITVTAVVRRRASSDPHLLRTRIDAKGGTRGFTCRLRVLVSGGTVDERTSALSAILASYDACSLPGGNHFEARSCDPRSLSRLTRPTWRHAGNWLSARELGALWKPPDAEVDVPGLARAGSRVIMPTDPALARGFAVGYINDGDRRLDIHLPRMALGGHTVVTGATGSGKSTWVQGLLYRAIQDPSDEESERLHIVVIDPHGPLVRGILGWYPRVSDRRPAVIRLADAERPIGYNPLDVTCGRSDGQIIAGLTIGFSRQWDGTWGSRMEMVFRQACLTLLRANRTLPPEKQYTLLDINPLLLNGGFLQDVLERTRDIGLYRYWRDQYVELSKTLRDQVITPVTSKMSRFEDETAARILGQRRGTIDIAGLVRDGIDILVDSDAYGVGPDTASILDSLLINAVADAVRERGPSGVRTVIVVDEAQHAPAVWETILTGIRAFGGSVILITQVTSAFESMQPGLRASIMGNVGTKVFFRAGEATEAEYLAKELGAPLTPADLQDLPAHHGYVKTTDGTRQLPLVSMRTALPPRAHPGAADFLARASAERYGTPADEIKNDRDQWIRRLFTTKNAELSEEPRFLRMQAKADLTAAATAILDDTHVDEAPPSTVVLPPGSSPGCTVAVTPRRRRKRTARSDGLLPSLGPIDKEDDEP